MQDDFSYQQTYIGMIAAVIYEPVRRSSKTRTLICVLPGFLDTKEYAHVTELQKTLASQGFTTVSFDFTGTWASGDDMSLYTVDRQVQDLHDVIEHMRREKSIDNVILVGHSMGGFVSILYTHTYDDILGVVAIMPAHSVIRKSNQHIIEKWKTEGVRRSLRDIEGSSEKKEFVLPYSYIEVGEKYNMKELVREVSVPVMYITSEADKLIVSDDVRDMYEATSSPKKFVMLEGVGHDYRKDLQLIGRVNQEVVKGVRWVQGGEV